MRQLLFLVFVSVGLASCSDQDIQPNQLNGHYEGTFSITNVDGTTTNDIQVDFENGTFNGNSVSNLHPAIGTGAFKIKNNDIQFTNASFWTANFDWNLILDGEFELNAIGEHIIFTKKINQVIYTYDLVKSN